MTLLISETGPSLSESDIAEFEGRLGAGLPSDYRKFLLEHNGGVPSRRRFGEGATRSAIRYFFSLKAESKYRDIDRYWQRHAWEFPEHTVPIATDSFGNYVLLRLSGDAPGQVLFFDHEEEGDDALQPLANSFSEFLESLVDPVEEPSTE